jgi:hypothetical protein
VHLHFAQLLRQLVISQVVSRTGPFENLWFRWWLRQLLALSTGSFKKRWFRWWFRQLDALRTGSTNCFFNNWWLQQLVVLLVAPGTGGFTGPFGTWWF